MKPIYTTFKYLRKFFAGFASVTPFCNSKLRGYPFPKPENALDKDWLDIGGDIEITTQKQNLKNAGK